jgi:G patch domain-containing protein 1
MERRASTLACRTRKEPTDISPSYFNTVGSKEGWAPSTFVSSRTNRRKDDPKAAQQRLEDFMDEEDLAEAEESRRIQTQAAFSGLGTTADDATRTSGLMGLFRAEGDTMGTKLLKRMGWKEGQGIGPKVRRKARLELRSDTNDPGGTHLFAPENVSMISFVRKTDHKGLGYAGETRLAPVNLAAKTSGAADSDSDEDGEGIDNLGRPKFTLATGRKKERDKSRGGIGVGILNDTGSDDEDPYEIRPRISYNRVIGGDKKKKKATTAINPTLKTKPAFIPSKKSALGKIALGVRKCHDGRLPLDGFVFGKEPDALTSEVTVVAKYAPPTIPLGWVSAKQPTSQVGAAGYVSTADAAKASTLDPKARAAILGEKQLPGKSVFDFMSADARERLAAVTGKTDLPPARGEVPAGHALSEADRLQELLNRVPRLDKQTAVAAISRGVGGGAPYRDDEAKRSRYISFLEYQAGFKPTPGTQPPKTTSEEWLRELHEFYNCARIFKPMTGFMASKFTTSTNKPSTNTGTGTSSSGGEAEARDLLSKPAPKPQDPAEEAAKLGMFGPMTRSVADFYPSRLLCKRFNVKPPAHVQPDDYPSASSGAGRAKYDAAPQFNATQDYGLRQEPLALEGGSGPASSTGTPGDAGSTPVREEAAAQAAVPEKIVVDASRNEALEGKRAGEDVFKAIFGDSDDED